MALELGTRLILRSAEDGSPLPAQRLKALVAAWAGIDADAGDLTDHPGRAGSRVLTRGVALADGRARWELRLARDDDDDPFLTWTVALTALFEADRTTMVTRLRRDATDHRLRPLAGFAQPPAVIRAVLGAPDVECFDGPVSIGPRFRTLRVGEAEHFVSVVLTAPDRRLPVLGVATAARDSPGRLDVNRLVKELAGFAHVVLVQRPALATLGQDLGPLSVAQDGVRLWWPGLNLDDASSTHPHWQGPFPEASATATTIRRMLLGVSRDRWREPTRLVNFARDLRAQNDAAGRAAAERVAAELTRLREVAGRAREQREQAAEGETEISRAAAETEQQLEAMARDLDEIRNDLERQRIAAQNAEDQWFEAEAKAERLEHDNRALSGRIEGLLAQNAHLRAAAGDKPETDEAALDREIHESWNSRMTEQDRERHPLAEFEIKPGFCQSITDAAAERSKVVDTAMEVLCGRAKEIPGRELHRLRVSNGANSAQRVRDSDGATAWRCNIQKNSASARRLHYWVCPGGRIELACVVVHDTFSIPD